MPSKDLMQQFLYSFQHNLTGVHGVISLVAQVQATLVNQGLTYTAVSYGTVGNSITVALVAGGVAGSEVVTVTGNAISVSMSDGTSTANQIKTAIQASTAATSLVTMTGASASAVNAVAATPLAGGIDGVVSSTIPGAASVVQTGVGEITITLSDLYNAFVFSKAMIVKAIAQDLIPQIKSHTVASTKIIVINLLTGATKTDPGAAAQLYVMLWMRNTGVTK